MIRKSMDWSIGILTAVGAAVLLMQVFLTTADVLLRYFLNFPITSSYELSEIAMGIIGPAALLYCAYKDEHVCVDILYERFPAWLQGICRIFSSLLVLLFSGIMAWQAWYQIQEVKEMGVTSPILQLPMWPVACMFLVCFMLFIPIACRNIVKKGEGK